MDGAGAQGTTLRIRIKRGDPGHVKNGGLRVLWLFANLASERPDKVE
jgi:hypothetical protein